MQKTVVVLIVAALLATSALADDGTPDKGDSSHAPDRTEREVQFQISGKEVEIESQQNNPAAHTEDKFKLKAAFSDEKAEVSLNQFSHVGDTSSGFQFRIRFHSLVEYVESDATAGFSAGDMLLKKYLIKGTSMTISAFTPTTINGTTVTTFTATTSDNVFGLKFYVAGSPSDKTSRTFVSNGRAVTPTSVKFDINIGSWSFNASYPTSRLALIAKVKSRQSTKTTGADASHTSAVQLGATATPLGFFTWATTVVVNNGASTANIIFGSLVPETGSNSDDESDLNHADGEAAARAVYSFDVAQPTSVSWDPELGYAAATNGAAARAVSALLLFACIVSAVFASRV